MSMVKVPDQGCSRRKALRVRAARGSSRYGHHTGSEGIPHTLDQGCYHYFLMCDWIDI